MPALMQAAAAGLRAAWAASKFRDWCGEATNYPRDLCEQALAHPVRNAVEAAYQRGDVLEKRGALMATGRATAHRRARRARRRTSPHSGLSTTPDPSRADRPTRQRRTVLAEDTYGAG